MKARWTTAQKASATKKPHRGASTSRPAVTRTRPPYAASSRDDRPAPDDRPENRLLRETLMDALSEALAELPAAQRQVFVWHELEDKSFKEMEAETGVPLKTLISRKHYAVLHLRKRLQKLYDELFTD